MTLPRRPPDAEGATPAMAQWFAAKAAHPDALATFDIPAEPVGKAETPYGH